MDINILKDAINYYFVNDQDNLINDNLDIFDYMIIKALKTFSCYIDKYERADYQQFRVYSIEERLKLVQKFFTDNKIQFDLDKIINDGTIGFNKETYEEEIYDKRLYKPFFIGENYYGNHYKKLIEVPNTGYFFDSAILVHEISHYRNQPDNRRNEVNDLMTEALAYTEEVIFCLQNLSTHQEEAQYGLKKVIGIFYDCINDLYPVIRLFNLYYNFSDISEYCYNLLYKNTSNYDKIIESQIKAINNDTCINFKACIWILVAVYLVPYLIINYQNNPLFLTKIEELHEKINTCNIKEILNFIGLEGNIYDIIDYLNDYLELFINNNLEVDKNVRK
jgi:hypothetical protein